MFNRISGHFILFLSNVYFCPGAIYIGEAGSSFQSLTSPIFLRNLQCTGTEDKLLDCDASPLGTHDEGCSHENDVVIRCQGVLSLC